MNTFRKFTLVSLVLLVFGSSIVWHSTDAQEKLPDLRDISPPSLSVESPVTPKENEAAENAIRSALDGNAAAAPGDDPLLQDVLDIIKDRGSIVDEPIFDLSDSEPRFSSEISSAPDSQIPDSRAHAAEALLRAARLLSSLPQNDSERRQLVNAMRTEAARCLRNSASK